MSGKVTPARDALRGEDLGAFTAGREAEVLRLVDEVESGELVVVSADEPTLASALGDAAAVELAERSQWAQVRADARVAADETDLARSIARSAAAAIGDLSALSVAEANETAEQARTRLNVRRVLGEQGFALASGAPDAVRGTQALRAATDAVIALRIAFGGPVVFVLHGVDELASVGKSRFDDGPGALWAVRGAWQRAPGPALLTGGRGAKAMAADKTHAFYGYGMLHEVQDLPADRVDAALRRLLGDVLDDDALADARRRVDQSLWLAPTLRRYLPDGRRATSAELAAAWAEMVSGRCAEHYELLRALSRLHRLAVPVLKAIAGGQGPYAGLDEHDRAAVTVFRALSALESNATIQRVGPRRWRLNDPTLASMLASSDWPVS